MRRPTIFLLALACTAVAAAAESTVKVADDAALREALRQAKPGVRIEIAPGNYRPGVYLSKLQGTAANPITIEGADPAAPPVFEGGSEGWHLSDCAYVTLRNLAIRGQSGNGINVDDGGTLDTPAHHIVLEKLHISDIGPTGNRDPIKLSGLDDFIVRNCVIDRWGGQAVDMVGCHRGLIEGCTFRGRPGYYDNAGPQTKGGSSQIVIRRCLFEGAIGRGVNIGGSTDLRVFRPQGAKYEARDIVVEGCVFFGGQAPLAFVGVDGAVARYNTIYRPERWVLRILQETTEPGFVPSRNGRFEHNLIVYRRADVRDFVNVGPHTQPESFRFAENLWYCEDRPSDSRPALPVAETGGVYGIDPNLADPGRGQWQPQNPRAARFGAAALPATTKEP